MMPPVFAGTEEDKESDNRGDEDHYSVRTSVLIEAGTSFLFREKRGRGPQDSQLRADSSKRRCLPSLHPISRCEIRPPPLRLQAVAPSCPGHHRAQVLRRRRTEHHTRSL